jgi:hypothetical protein
MPGARAGVLQAVFATMAEPPIVECRELRRRVATVATRADDDNIA